MIIDRENLNFKYFSKCQQRDISLTVFEERLISKYFREELKILPEHKIDYKSPEVLLLVDLIRFSNYLS